MTIPEPSFRTGTPADADWLLGLFDGAVEWLVGRGQPGQWGSELYINLLLVSRAHAGLRIGEALVARAVAEARELGVEVVRVDCWAGAPSLVAWYEARGFTRSSRFTVQGDWTGQVFELQT